jgi:hypothetical protein
VIFIAQSNKDNQFIDLDTLDDDGFKLKVVNDPYQLKNCYDIVFVDKSVFKYSSGAGLELGAGNRVSPLKPYTKNEKETIEYKKDTFIQSLKSDEYLKDNKILIFSESMETGLDLYNSLYEDFGNSVLFYSSGE